MYWPCEMPKRIDRSYVSTAHLAGCIELRIWSPCVNAASHLADGSLFLHLPEGVAQLQPLEISTNLRLPVLIKELVNPGFMVADMVDMPCCA